MIIQTSEPDNRTLQQVANNDFEAMARCELDERHSFGYPPFARLVRLTMRHEELPMLRQGAKALAEALRKSFGGRVLGPVTPPIDRIRGEYIIQILIKIENGRSMARARELLRGSIAKFSLDRSFKQINIAIDVDAQ